MNLQLSCKILILVVITMFNHVSLAQQEEQPGGSSQCNFGIVNRDVVKQTFEEMSNMEDAWLIFFKITLLPKIAFKEKNYDEGHINDLTRWIWVPKKHSYLLTYPVDLAVITFRISKKVERIISLSVNASFGGDYTNFQNYSICIESIYNSILKNVLDGNKTDWLFCNRYFEGQNYKHVLYELTGAWLGYDFACFDSVHKTVSSATSIKTGTVNIVINICIIALCLYFPLLYLLLPDRYNTDEDAVRFYRKREYPYSFARFLLQLHDTCKQEITEISSVEEWFDQFDITQFKPEIHLFSFMYIVTMAMYIFEDQYMKQVIPDYNYSPKTFPPFLSDMPLGRKVFCLTCSYFITIPLFIIAMSYFSQSNSKYWSANPRGLIKIKDVWKNVEQKEETYIGYTKFAKKFLHRMSLFFSLDLWATTFTYPCTDADFLTCFPCCSCLSCCSCCSCCTCSPCLKCCPVCSCCSRCSRCSCYSKSTLKIRNICIISICFLPNVCLYFLFLLVPNIYFVIDCSLLFPLKMMKLMFKNKNKCILLIVVLFFLLFWVNFTLLFRSCFLFVIQFIFRSIVYVIFVAGPLFANISDTTYTFWIVFLSGVIYLVKYAISFHRNYKKLLSIMFKFKSEQMKENKGNDDMKTVKISVDNFDRIAEKYIPFRHQMFIFFLKITITSLFLYVTFDSLTNVENNQYTISLLPTILTVAIPAIVEKLCSPINFDETLKLHNDEIKSDFLASLSNNHDNISKTIIVNSIPTCKHIRRLMLGFPVVYSVLVFVCFICKTICLRHSPVMARPCSFNCESSCTNKNNDREPESFPLRPVNTDTI